MLDLRKIDIEELATVLADQTGFEHRWVIDPRKGQGAFWTSDTGIEGENPVEIDELDLTLIVATDDQGAADRDRQQTNHSTAHGKWRDLLRSTPQPAG